MKDKTYKLIETLLLTEMWLLNSKCYDGGNGECEKVRLFKENRINELKKELNILNEKDYEELEKEFFKESEKRENNKKLEILEIINNEIKFIEKLNQEQIGTTLENHIKFRDIILNDDFNKFNDNIKILNNIININLPIKNNEKYISNLIKIVKYMESKI